MLRRVGHVTVQKRPLMLPKVTPRRGLRRTVFGVVLCRVWRGARRRSHRVQGIRTVPHKRPATELRTRKPHAWTGARFFEEGVWHANDVKSKRCVRWFEKRSTRWRPNFKALSDEGFEIAKTESFRSRVCTRRTLRCDPAGSVCEIAVKVRHRAWVFGPFDTRLMAEWVSCTKAISPR